MQLNKGNIYISGGGNAPETYIIDEHFVKSLQNRRILYIPIGLKRNIVGYEGCYDWISRTLQKYSSKPLTIEMWVNLKKLTYKHLTSFDAVYIGGASSSYKLLDLIEKFKTNELLIRYFTEGGTLYGGSSGGIILGNNINTSNNDCGDRKGISLIMNYSIECHSKLNVSDPDNKRNSTIPLISLPENSGILYNNNKVTVLGLSSINIITKDNVSVINPGDISII